MIKQFVSKIYNSSLKELIGLVSRKLGKKGNKYRFDKTKIAQSLVNNLKATFEIYQTTNLKGITAKDFSSYIYSKIGSIDYKSEGYMEDEFDKQRDLSIKFHWGHNHNFGEFYLPGMMGDRHINVLANFITLFPVSLESFHRKRVFDIGCWTGGTTLLLSALGSKVFAIEEVKKYVEMVEFLAKSFGIE